MSERTDITDRIATLEAERAGLAIMEGCLHDRFMASPPCSDEARTTGVALGKILIRLDAISDELGALRAQLYLLDAAVSRREHLADRHLGGWHGC